MKNYDRIHFDIGANEGVYAIHFARHEPNTLVVAFEPTPALIDKLKYNTNNLNNFVLVPSAVSNFDGTSKFHISPESQFGDYSCSSLLEFSDKSQTEWPGRNDFKTINEITVQVIRLDTYVVNNQIPKIDYLKIDTQGADLKVLEGCGELLSIVNEGTMEAAAKRDILYKGQNTEEESINFLVENGFDIVKIESNDIHNNEVNIYFKNRTPRKLKFKNVWFFE
jgi:FkbM family methyltransferase